MYYLLGSTLALVVRNAFAQQAQSFPACANDCVTSLLPASCNLDPSCICSNSTSIIDFECCAYPACNSTDYQAALEYLHSICDPVASSSLVPANVTCTGASSGVYTTISGIYASGYVVSTTTGSRTAAPSLTESTVSVNTASPPPSESTIAFNTHHSDPGLKIGIAVAVPVGVILIAVILAVFLIRRRRRRKIRQNNESQPNDAQDEVQDGQGHPETYYKKPELEAEPVIDPTIRGPVKPKFELRSQGTVKRKTVGDPKATDAVEAPNTNRPRNQGPGGSMLPELHPDPLSEAGTSSLTEPEMRQLKQQAGASKTSTSTSTVVPSSSDQSFLQPFQTISAEASELAEEADVIVQELGLINLRKKALTTQASAIGQKPGDIEGRKGEEFKELLERDARLKGRLDEIERERHGQK